MSAGYLETTLSDVDARRRNVRVAAAGLELLAEAHRWQETVFAQLTTRWTDQQREDFHRAMLCLLERSHVLDS